MKSPAPLPDARYFSHEAMRTTFTLRLRDVDETTARGIARLCFERIDLLESQLSRYAEGGDVWRINHLAAGETLYLSEACHRCLMFAIEAGARTGGLFDITLGTRIEHRKSRADGPPPPLTGVLTLHPDVAAITCGEPGREIDLGGVGKGFALDEIRGLLEEWEVTDALVAAGASSLLAMGPQSWPVDLAGGDSPLRVGLANRALSASGTGIQGAHIVHPQVTDGEEYLPSSRIWVMAESAALAEVWSTALMMVDPDLIPDFISGESGIAAVYAEQDGVIRTLRHPDGGG
jgi:FAD:protein FMN transferase